MAQNPSRRGAKKKSEPVEAPALPPAVIEPSPAEVVETGFVCGDCVPSTKLGQELCLCKRAPLSQVDGAQKAAPPLSKTSMRKRQSSGRQVNGLRGVDGFVRQGVLPRLVIFAAVIGAGYWLMKEKA